MADQYTRFDSYIFRTPTCWIWTGAIESRGGYGRFRSNQGVVAAHRYAWTASFGQPDLPIVRHRCDVRVCVNPNHLQVGTQADNIEDTIRRHRRRTTADTSRRSWPNLAYLLRTAAQGADTATIAVLLAEPEQLSLLPTLTTNPIVVPANADLDEMECY